LGSVRQAARVSAASRDFAYLVANDQGFALDGLEIS